MGPHFVRDVLCLLPYLRGNLMGFFTDGLCKSTGVRKKNRMYFSADEPNGSGGGKVSVSWLEREDGDCRGTKSSFLITECI